MEIFGFTRDLKVNEYDQLKPPLGFHLTVGYSLEYS